MLLPAHWSLPQDSLHAQAHTDLATTQPGAAVPAHPLLPRLWRQICGTFLCKLISRVLVAPESLLLTELMFCSQLATGDYTVYSQAATAAGFAVLEYDIEGGGGWLGTAIDAVEVSSLKVRHSTELPLATVGSQAVAPMCSCNSCQHC